jgi:hypothetical protein
MNLRELQDAVYVATNRPDLVELTLQRVLAATLKVHGIEFFPRDITACQVKFDQAAYIQSIDLDVLPRFRKLSYFRKNDPAFSAFQQNPTILPPIFYNGGTPQQSVYQMTAMLNCIDPDNIFDIFGYQKNDVCYLAGASILIKSSTPLNWGLIGFYQRPLPDAFTEDNGVSYPRYVSWIANDYPYAIVYDAAASILNSIGMLDAARMYDREPDPNKPQDKGGLAQQQFAMIIQDNLLLGMSS